MADTTITGLPNATTPLDGTERVPMDQAGVTVDATTQDIADLVDAEPAGTAAAAVAAHEAAPDPHPGYLTAAEGDAAYDAIGAAAAAQSAAEATAAGALSSHEAAVDPHPGYAQESALGGAAALNVGTTAGTVAAGDDARLSDARTPTAHASTHAAGQSDALSPADIGAATAAQGSLADSAVQPSDDADTLGSGDATDGHVLTADGLGGAAWEAPPAGSGSTDLSYTASTRLLESSSGADVVLPEADGSNAGLMSSADYVKLLGVETGATADQTATEIQIAYESLADRNPYTDAEQTKLAGIEAGAEVNVNADWDAVSGNAVILNKPTLGNASALNVGTTAGTVAAGDDARLSDARTPTAHASTHATGQADALSPADIGAATTAQGGLADSAVQPGDLATVATTGAYSDLSGLPTLGTAAAAATTDFAPAAQGVTNGNSHNHDGGDGAQIAYSSLSGLPTLGTAAATASTDYATAAQGTKAELVELVIACSDETTALVAGTGVRTFRMPFAMTLQEVRASVNTAPTGSTLIVDINEGGTTVLGTKLSIDATEKTSETAAAAATITDSGLADDAEISVDIDQIGATVAGAGLKIALIGVRA